MLQYVSACPQVKFLCFATFFLLKLFAAETNKKLTSVWIFFLFQQQKFYVANEKTWENPRVPGPWVDFLKHFFFYPIKFIESSKQTKTFHPKHFTTRWRIVKTYSRNKSCLVKKKQLLSTFINRIKAFWSLGVNFWNKEEKSAVKEDLVSLFDERFSEDFLDRSFHALRITFNKDRRNTKIKLQRRSGSFLVSYPFWQKSLRKRRRQWNLIWRREKH